MTVTLTRQHACSTEAHTRQDHQRATLLFVLLLRSALSCSVLSYARDLILIAIAWRTLLLTAARY